MSDPKQATQRTCEEVARELLSQPALFLEFDGVDGFTPPAQAVQRYTGERSTRDEERLLKVGALRLLGASDREIEQACGVTRRTIPLLLAELERTGRITPLKQRLALATGDNAERANIALRLLLDRVGQPRTKTVMVKGEEVEVTDDGISVDLAAMIKAVSTALGITTEKVLLLTGQATEIVETRVQAGREEFETWWRDEVKPVTMAIDSVSPDQPHISDANGPTPAQRHDPDTSPASDQAQPPTIPPASDPGREGAGGGSASAGGGGNPN